jgi:hypothetical protein
VARLRGRAQLASACQSGIRQGDAVASLLPDEVRIDQGVKGRGFALVRSAASPTQSDAAQQFGLLFAPRRQHLRIFLRRLIPGKGASEVAAKAVNKGAC